MVTYKHLFLILVVLVVATLLLWITSHLLLWVTLVVATLLHHSLLWIALLHSHLLLWVALLHSITLLLHHWLLHSVALLHSHVHLSSWSTTKVICYQLYMNLSLRVLLKWTPLVSWVSLHKACNWDICVANSVICCTIYVSY